MYKSVPCSDTYVPICQFLSSLRWSGFQMNCKLQWPKQPPASLLRSRLRLSIRVAKRRPNTFSWHTSWTRRTPSPDAVGHVHGHGRHPAHRRSSPPPRLPSQFLLTHSLENFSNPSCGPGPPAQPADPVREPKSPFSRPGRMAGWLWNLLERRKCADSDVKCAAQGWTLPRTPAAAHPQATKPLTRHS